MTFKKQVEVLTKKNHELAMENLELRRSIAYHSFPYIIPIVLPKKSFECLNDPLGAFMAGEIVDE